MKQTRLVRMISLLSLMLVISIPSSGCKELLKLANSQRPKLEFKNLGFRNVSLAGLTMDFNFLVKNPNPLAVTFSRVAYQLDFNGNKLFKGVQKKGLQLKANGASPFTMPFSIEYVKFVKSILGFFQKKKSIPYKLAMGVDFQVPVLGNVRLPFTKSGNVPVPSIPKIRVVGASKPQFTGGLLNAGVKFAFKVGMKNENKFPVNVKGLQYALKIAGKSIVSGTTKAMGVKGSNEQIVEIPVTIRVAQVGMAIFNMIRSGSFKYDFGGNLNMGMFKLPFNKKGDLKM